MSPWKLTDFAEVIADRWSEDRAIPMLLKLIEHPSPIVREGAIYGFERYVDENSIAQEALKRHADKQFESSPGVRNAATEILDTL